MRDLFLCLIGDQIRLSYWVSSPEVTSSYDSLTFDWLVPGYIKTYLALSLQCRTTLKSCSSSKDSKRLSWEYCWDNFIAHLLPAQSCFLPFPFTGVEHNCAGQVINLQRSYLCLTAGFPQTPLFPAVVDRIDILYKSEVYDQWICNMYIYKSNMQYVYTQICICIYTYCQMITTITLANTTIM